MDLQYNNSSEHGRNEQIVSQFLLKSLHIVLDSRVPSIRASGRRGNTLLGSQVKKSDKWFNLALGERPSALDSLNFWHRNLMEPMIIDIILVGETGGGGECATSGSGSGYGALVETVIERWVVQYEYSRTNESSLSYKKTYKKSIILLRSLYTMLRLLPAYRAYRKLYISSSKSCCGFDINYKVSSFSAPFTRAEEESMKQYSFIPIEAQHGRLSVSVKYRESLAEFNLETSASFPAEIITDYVGSPATDPFRAFPKGMHATSFPVREMQSAAPPQRPHSWTSGGAHLSTHVYGQNYRPPGPQSFDDYQLSPPFSPSPSPSPPTYLSGGKSRLTAPVSIPTSMMTRYLSPNLSDPSRHLPPPSPKSTRSHESPSGIKSLKKSDMSRVSRDNKDDSGRFSSSSSRLSLQDELDDIDFSCPFIVDDVDTCCDSPVSVSERGKEASKKSQDAAVGALVRMLRTAPPLRQDSSCFQETADALEDLKAYTHIKHLILSKSLLTKDS